MNKSANEFYFPLFRTKGIPTNAEASDSGFPVYTGGKYRKSVSAKTSKNGKVVFLLFKCKRKRWSQSIMFLEEKFAIRLFLENNESVIDISKIDRLVRC